MTPGTEASSYLQGSIDIERQIAALQMQRTQTASRYAPTTREVRTIDEQLATLNAQKQAFDQRFGRLPASERKLMDLTRDAKVAEDIYVAMREKASALAVTRAGTIGNVHLVDSAIYPTDPAKPKRPLIIAGGAAAGMIIGLLFVFFRDQLSRNVKTPEAIERRLSLPVFGAVSFSPVQARLDRRTKPSLLASKSRALSLTGNSSARASGDESASEGGIDATQLLSAHGDQDMAVDALRAVHASLMHDIAPAQNNVLAIVGAAPGTGKTFVASNLAVLHAQSGKSVLLIDGDMRRGRIASMFGRTNTNGLSEVLAGKVHVDQAVGETDIPGLADDGGALAGQSVEDALDPAHADDPRACARALRPRHYRYARRACRQRCEFHLGQCRIVGHCRASRAAERRRTRRRHQATRFDGRAHRRRDLQRSSEAP